MPIHTHYHGCGVDRPEAGGQVMLCGQNHVVSSPLPPIVVDELIRPGGKLQVPVGVLTAASVAANAVTQDGSPVGECLMDLGGESFNFGVHGPLQWHRDQVMARNFADALEVALVFNRSDRTVRFMLTVLPEEMIDSEPLAAAEAELEDADELVAAE